MTSPISREQSIAQLADSPISGLSIPTQHEPIAHADAYCDWLETELQELESSFESYVTISSQRKSLRRSRG